MKKYVKILAAVTLVFLLLINATSCFLIGETPPKHPQENNGSIVINGGDVIKMTVGDTLTLTVTETNLSDGDILWSSSSSCATVDKGVVSALDVGVTIIKATVGEFYDTVIINIVEEEYIFGSEYPAITVAEAREIAADFVDEDSEESYYLIAEITHIESLYKGEMTITDETGSIYVYKSTDINGNRLSETELELGDIIIISGTLRNYKGTLEIERGQIVDFYTPGEDDPSKPDQGGNGDNGGNGGDGGNSGVGGDVIIPDDDPITSDPYVGVDTDEFYENYTPAISYMDSYYRTMHNLMSGSIYDQDQAPTISSYQPKSNGKLIKNSECLYSDDKNTYYVVDCYGEIAFEIYRGGAYVVLEEVAAYVYAFGEPPVNQSYSKNGSPLSSPWGEYLRLNHSYFSGDTSRYPYEPVLPDISGCGGSLRYYEMDVGTTGTDCDPSYPIEIYNDGYSITRGAARIVYTYQDKNGNGVIEFNERYLFYTYNHYNDFREYLNYEGGWGEMFGNITGGGTISSKYDYNPTPYVSVEYAPIANVIIECGIYYYVPKNELVA